MKVLLSKALMAPDRAYIAEAAGGRHRDRGAGELRRRGRRRRARGGGHRRGGSAACSPSPCSSGRRRAGYASSRSRGTGVDNVDFDALARHGTTLCNSHSNGALVAEHAVALMLAAAKKIPYHDRLLREGALEPRAPRRQRGLAVLAHRRRHPRRHRRLRGDRAGHREAPRGLRLHRRRGHLARARSRTARRRSPASGRSPSSPARSPGTIAAAPTGCSSRCR